MIMRTTTTIRVSDEERAFILDGALERDITLSEYVRQAAAFYRAFPPEFLKRIKEEAEAAKMEPATFLVNLFCAYTAQEAALVSEGLNSNVREYAFRYDEKGLIDPNEAGIRTFNEVKEKIQKIKRRAEAAARQGKPAVLDGYEKGLMAHAV